MSKFKSVQIAQQRISEILSNAEAERSSITKQIDEDMENIRKADAKLREAEASGDTKNFIKAKEAVSNASEILAMHERRLKTLRSGSLISAEEYQKLCDDIQKDLRGEMERVKGEIISHALKMNDLANELNSDATEANRVLAQLQHDVNRDEDQPKDNAGRVIYQISTQKYVDVSAVVRIGKDASKDSYFQNVTGIYTD